MNEVQKLTIDFKKVEYYISLINALHLVNNEHAASTIKNASKEVMYILSKDYLKNIDKKDEVIIG